MSLELDRILITGRTYEEYMAFFDLDVKELVGKKVLDCPSGVSSFISDAKDKNIDTYGCDILYQFDVKDIKAQGEFSIEKIYEDISWMDGFNFNFYKSIENHRATREYTLKRFFEIYDKNYYRYNELPKLEFKDNSFDLVLSSHLLFVYDDRFNYEFHKSSILEMLRVGCELRLFPLVDFQNSNEHKQNNFSPFVYKIIEDLESEFKCDIIKVGFEFQPKANYMLKIVPK